MDRPLTTASGARSSDRDSSRDAGAATDEARHDAAAWLIRRRSQDWTPASEQAWQRWLRANPANASAYAEAERTWSELAGLRLAPELLAAPASDVAPSRPRSARWPSPRVASPWRRRALRQGVALAFLVAAAAALTDPPIAWRADHRTAVAEIRELALPDGSRVKLGGDSALAVHYDATERRVELLAGEALFEAAPLRADVPGGERRPFVVTAGAGATRALGTRFIVERLSDHTQVTGVEHRVAVSLGTAPQAAAIVAPGQVVRYDARGIGPVEPAGVDAGQAWDRGLLVFERATLADVVARLNRYCRVHIVVRGDALAHRRVSGVFKVADGDAALQAVTDELGARLLRLPGLAILY